MPTREEIATTIRRAIKSRYGSQARFARESGIYFGTVRSWCTGQSTPSADRRSMVAQALGVDEASLVDENAKRGCRPKGKKYPRHEFAPVAAPEVKPPDTICRLARAGKYGTICADCGHGVALSACGPHCQGYRDPRDEPDFAAQEAMQADDRARALGV